MYDLLPGKLYQTFFTVMIIMAVAFGLRALFYYVITFLGHRFGICVEADIREDLYQHFQELVSIFDKNRTGKLMNRLTGDLFEITELAHHGPRGSADIGGDYLRRSHSDVRSGVETGSFSPHHDTSFPPGGDTVQKEHGKLIRQGEAENG